MTEPIKRAEHGSEWCTTASMRALGHSPREDKPRLTCEITKELVGAGFSLSEVPGAYSWPQYEYRNPTLRRLIADLGPGRYIIFTAGHALALADGVLTDTANRTLRRRVRSAYRVEAPQ